MDNNILIFVLLGLVVVYFIIQRIITNREQADNKFPYYAKETLLTKSELNFYKQLQPVVGNHLVICPQVRLWGVVDVNRKAVDGNKGWARYKNKISQKHVDFVLCDPDTMAIKLAIELDDKSHERKDRIERDKFVNKLFEVCEIPLVRIKTNKSYPAEMLQTQLQAYLPQPEPEGQQ